MIYICTKCGEPVQKGALVAVPGWKSAPVSDFEVGLGHWHCKCGNSKVRAVKGEAPKGTVKKHDKKRFKKRNRAKAGAKATPVPKA